MVRGWAALTHANLANVQRYGRTLQLSTISLASKNGPKMTHSTRDIADHHHYEKYHLSGPRSIFLRLSLQEWQMPKNE